jgi:hypothetical protein
MTGNAARRCFLLVGALALAACSAGGDYFGKPKEVEPNIFPKEYKKQITDTMTRLLDDPTNVRDAYISDPVLTTVGKDQRYTLCVRSNSRDQAHNYIGSKDRIAYFYGGLLNQLVDATPEQCAKAAYKPFPELEKLCLGKSCE